MGAITGTKTKLTEFSGVEKLVVISCTPTTASDEITLTQATHGISVITAVLATSIISGQTTTFQSAHSSFSGLVITLVTLNGAGGNATTWGNVVITLVGY